MAKKKSNQGRPIIHTEQTDTCGFVMERKNAYGETIHRKCIACAKMTCVSEPNKKCAFYKTKEEIEFLKKKYPYRKDYSKWLEYRQNERKMREANALQKPLTI